MPPRVATSIDSLQLRTELATRKIDKRKSREFSNDVLIFPAEKTPPGWASFNLGYGIHFDTENGFTFDISYFISDKTSFFLELEILDYLSYPDPSGKSITYMKDLIGFYKNGTPIYLDKYGLRTFAAKTSDWGGHIVMRLSNPALLYEQTEDELRLVAGAGKSSKIDTILKNNLNHNFMALNSEALSEMQGYWLDDDSYEIKDWLRIEYLGDRIEFYPLNMHSVFGGQNKWEGFNKTSKWTFIKIEDSYYFYNDNYQGVEITVSDDKIIYSIENKAVYQFKSNSINPNFR